jgi:hypothetical protein
MLMLSRLCKRFTYANVTMTLALVFAMSGGAYAARHYLITSTKQINPKVLKALAGKRGPAGANGANGSNGRDGAPGPPGEKGAPGEKGVPGESVTSKEVKPGEPACSKLGGGEFKVGATTTFACNGKEGPEGPQGEPWTAGGTLPSGKTEKGVYSFGQSAEGKPQLVAFSFTIPLAATLDGAHVHYVHKEESPPPEACQGTPTEPTAASGNLCVYEQALVGGTFANVFRPSLAPGIAGADVGGAGLRFSPSEVTSVLYGWGTWAVTAP